MTDPIEEIVLRGTSDLAPQEYHKRLVQFRRIARLAYVAAMRRIEASCKKRTENIVEDEWDEGCQEAFGIIMQEAGDIADAIEKGTQ